MILSYGNNNNPLFDVSKNTIEGEVVTPRILTMMLEGDVMTTDEQIVLAIQRKRLISTPEPSRRKMRCTALNLQQLSASAKPPVEG